MGCFSYEGGCGIYISRHLKVLTWAVVKYFWFSNDAVLLKTAMLLSYQRIKLENNIMYVAMWSLVTV